MKEKIAESGRLDYALDTQPQLQQVSRDDVIFLGQQLLHVPTDAHVPGCEPERVSENSRTKSGFHITSHASHLSARLTYRLLVLADLGGDDAYFSAFPMPAPSAHPPDGCSTRRVPCSHVSSLLRTHHGEHAWSPYSIMRWSLSRICAVFEPWYPLAPGL